VLGLRLGLGIRRFGIRRTEIRQMKTNRYTVDSNLRNARIDIVCTFYRAMLAQSTVMRLHVVCLSVRPSVMIRYRDQIGWNSSKIVSRLNSLWPMCSLTPNMGDLVQREHPQN